MTPVYIDDADDPRIAGYRDIRDRDLALRDNLFIAEGKVVLTVLFSAARYKPQSVLLLENRLAGMSDVLVAAPPAMPVYVAAQTVIDQIAGFHLHRGVLALVKRREPESVAQLISDLPAKALVVALVGISNHDNMGGIFRNAAAFGADAVLLEQTCCDPLYRKAIRVSVGATLKIPFAAAPDWQGLTAALGAAGFDQIALTPSGETDLAIIAAGARTAIFLGTEGDGLPAELLSAMKGVRIKMADDFDSLNVAAASAIALHSLSAAAR